MKRENRKLIGGSIAALFLPLLCIGFVARWMWFVLTAGYEAGEQFIDWLTK